MRKQDHNRKPGSFLKVLQLVTYIFCSCGFIFGTYKAWLKYYSEPLSSTVTKQGLQDEVLPSASICRFELATMHKANMTKITLDDMMKELSMEVVLTIQGYASKVPIKKGTC